MRKIAIVTERRADYSRFKPILERIRSAPDLDYQLIVTGVSLLEEHGKDIEVVLRDGFTIAAEVPMFEPGTPDTGAEMTRALGRVMGRLAVEFERLQPDIILAGFDIGANLAAAIVGAHMNILVAHIQGGEVTGSIDESLRHAMTKFAHLHFPATADAGQRLVRMGEDPRSIYVVGCPSLDLLLRAPDIGVAELAKEFPIDFHQPYVLILQHPVTTEAAQAGWQMAQTLAGVKSLQMQALVIYPNNDAGSQGIIRELQDSRIAWVRSVPPERYINLLKRSAALVGNSSSGIHETASLGVPTVNVGTRQDGRQRPENVIDVEYGTAHVAEGLRRSLDDIAFREKVRMCRNPYGDGHAAERIVEVLQTVPLGKNLQKRFLDAPQDAIHLLWTEQAAVSETAKLAGGT